MGRPRRLGADYLGVDVNVAARLVDGAAAGEILASDALLARIDPERVRAKREALVPGEGHAEGPPGLLAGARARAAGGNPRRCSVTRALKIVGLGGSLARVSRSRAALQVALAGAEGAGAETTLLDLRALALPMYDPDDEAPPRPRRG